MSEKKNNKKVEISVPDKKAIAQIQQVYTDLVKCIHECGGPSHQFTWDVICEMKVSTLIKIIAPNDITFKNRNRIIIP